jgi:hypothetical protein
MGFSVTGTFPVDFAVRELTEKRRKVARAMAYWRCAELRRALNSFAANVTARRQAELAVRRWAASALASALSGWREVVRKQRAALLRWTKSSLTKVRVI